MDKPGEWKKMVLEFSAENCAIVEASLRSIYPDFPEEGYVQLIYAIGGGVEMFFIPCH